MDALTGLTDLLGLSQGKSQQDQAKAQLAMQNAALKFTEGIAQQVQQNQQQLYNAAAPAYAPTVNQLLFNAGLGGINAAGTPSPYGTFTPAAGTAADVGPNGTAAPGMPAAGGAPPSNPVLSNYQGQGAAPPAPGMVNAAAAQFDANGNQTTGYGAPRTGAPVVTNPNVHGGQPYAAFGSRRTAPGTTTQYAAGTPVAPINVSGQRLPGYTGPQSTTPGQTTYYPQGSSAANTGGQGQQGGITGVPTNMLGIFNLPQEQLQYQAAREDIDRATRANENNLRFNLGVQGAGANTIASALQRTGDQGIESEAAFRRNLAIQAPQLQEQNTMNALQALSPGLNAGTNTGAGSLSSNVAGQYGANAQNQQQLANQTFGQVGGSIGNYQQNQILQKALNNQGHAAPVSPGPTPPVLAAPTPGGAPTDQTPITGVTPGYARGGVFAGGRPIIVGEQGPEEILPMQPGLVVPNYALRAGIGAPQSPTQGLLASGLSQPATQTAGLSQQAQHMTAGLSPTPNLDRYIALLRGR